MISRFKDIDPKLEQLSKRLNASLTKDRLDYPAEPPTFEERRIDWEKDHIRRAIIIQPTFEVGGVDSTRWNLVNVAWNGEGCSKRRYIKRVVEEKDFTAIAENIDTLLEASEKTLTSLSENDLG